ncbi:hypothetical protein GDO86_003304 [Hymenochirus boettgeri]|uniref:Ladinin-1 n=1 Tax=Hymenochirus boettgeri TaxID=247094 RepID=A0A8T2K8R2_9PIPI|nr:hypothetical protein GDO86_003304 [Hymenochirus boettgeri]
MSISRGNWSALSRLARQWSEDDEEEQIRERRRRNRILSNPGEKVIEVLSEESDTTCPTPVQSSNNNEDNEDIKTRQTKVNKLQELHTFNALETESESQRARTQKKIHQVENKSHCTDPPKNINVSKGEKVENERKHKKEILQDETQTEQSLLPEKQSKERSKLDKSLDSSQYPRRQNHKDQEPEIPVQDNCVPVNQRKYIPETPSRIRINCTANFPKGSRETWKIQEDKKNKEQRMEKSEGTKKSAISPDESRMGSEVAAITSLPSDAAPRNSFDTNKKIEKTDKFRSQVFVRSTNVSQQQGADGKEISQSIETTLPIQNKTEDNSATVIKTTKRSVVRIPSLSNRHQSIKEDEISTSPPSVSILTRLSPRTSSFRAISQCKGKEDGGEFTRSSHLRFSLRSRKIDDRMEKYTSAVQRSGSVRASTNPSRCVIGASDGVASKRCIFEKDDKTSNNIRKDITLPVTVSARINQWANKTQEDSAGVRTKEIRISDVSSKRKLWQQRSQSSQDT